MAKHQFQTEVNQLLHLIIHSLYSHKEIFLRELISNSSDALDKLKYLTLTDDSFKNLSFDPRIDITFSEEGDEKTLSVSDTGIGMNQEDLVENLGTIARSGTRTFLGNLTGDSKKDSNLIGQFGVGFYSVFMVADRAEVVTRKAGEETAWKWVSDGQGAFEITPAERESCGTTVTLHLGEEGREFASRWQIEQIVKKYSNHIAFPIFLHYEKAEYDEEGKEKGSAPAEEQINTAAALWKRPRNEITPEEYNEFYKTISHDGEDPLMHLHTRAEGTMEYTTLFYVPSRAPLDMYQVDYRPGVKLYVKRVFITDDEKNLMPTYLRFLRGVIDSEDLPLNVSREILQQNRVMAKIRESSVKKVLGEFARIAREDSERWLSFVEHYNRPLKEGLYSDFANRDTLLELVRFRSTKVEGWTSLAEYKERMLPDQKAIYYITGDNEQTLRNSPLLEAYRRKDLEVLIMADDVDELVVPMIGTYQEVELKSVNRSDAGKDLEAEKDQEKDEALKPLLERMKAVLGDRVKDVVTSVRLADSPSCIVVDESDPTMKMAQMMKAMGQTDLPEIKPILEVNPDSAIVLRMKELSDEDRFADAAFLLLDQALLVEGSPVKDPADFVKRLNRVMEQGLA
ncbi:molecular chaperone HtpG [Alkalispirochaeta sphaeroplastigenens]|uniref:Chaperone protein HtpG n=1 Tax=Alkalispirochaeta sphaeroplastigenens TaxID=1187066 RepID=A0A2S4JRQ8_9SPIO|nr:molecular chaperone HtpG [Alkalispirochaeta sphaeroplastigenens]POR02205.1 molecular chaperone HtpG [Alkalispirochaeta sphaeroplastigenens]